MGLGIAAAGERGRIEIDDDRALLQRVPEREGEFLAGERRGRLEVRRLFAFLEGRENGQGKRAGEDDGSEDTGHGDPFLGLR